MSDEPTDPEVPAARPSPRRGAFPTPVTEIEQATPYAPATEAEEPDPETPPAERDQGPDADDPDPSAGDAG